MVKCIAYGSEKGGIFYVQACCDKAHNGAKCDCKSFGENFSEDEARELANQKSKELNIPLEVW